MKVTLMALAFGFVLAAGLPLAATAGPLPGGADSDGDGVEDGFDNCLNTSNTNQTDTDHDGCGDPCDNLATEPNNPDVTGDTLVGGADFLLLSSDWLNSNGGPGDITGDTLTGGGDFLALSGAWLDSSGPSGLTNPGRDSTTCFGPGGPGT